MDIFEINISYIWTYTTSRAGLKFLTHSSVADNCSLSFLQFEHISTVSSVGKQEVELGSLIRTFKQWQIHTLKKKNIDIFVGSWQKDKLGVKKLGWLSAFALSHDPV